MGGKIVVSVISIILVVGVVIGVVALVHRDWPGKGGKNNNNGILNKDEDLSSSMKTVNALCAPTTYKDACIKSLGSVAHNESAVPQDYVKAGVKLALEEILKAANLTNTLIPKAKETKNANRTHMAISSCQDVFNLAVDRLEGAISDVHNNDVYKHKDRVWNLRLWFTDVITFSTNCVDEFEEAEAPDLKKIMEDGVVDAKELTTSMLDIVTTFNEMLGNIGLNLNATKLGELVTGEDESKATSNSRSRRLLSTPMPVNEEGLPTWFSEGDRRILVGGKKAAPKNKNNKEKKAKSNNNKGKGNKNNKGKNKLKVGAGAATGATISTPSVPIAAGSNLKPNAVVAQDGSGQFKTIMDALKDHPGKGVQGRYVIYVKAGIYKEEVLVGKEQPNVYMYGDGPLKTIITGSKSFKGGFQTSKTAPFNVEGMNFFARDMGFQNTAGPQGHQAVALRVNGLQAVFQNCWFDAFQDTLYVQGGSQFFRDCQIAGTVDFIFGNGATLIQNSKMLPKKGLDGQTNLVTAQGGVAANEPTGIVIQGGEILPDKELFPLRFKQFTYLGRPWKPFCKTVFIKVMMGDLIKPEGYQPWAGNANIDTAFYGEYNNRGPGADTSRRIKWKNVKALSPVEAQRYATPVFLGGCPWVKALGVPLS